jgi:hypothetical protein
MVMKEAEKLFTETYLMCNKRFGAISSFRSVSRLGLPEATHHVYGQSLKSANELVNDLLLNEILKDKQEADEMFGNIEVLGGNMAKYQLEQFIASVDAASLIFAHSILDSVALDYCRCSALVSSSDWQIFIENKQVSLGEIRDSSYENIIRNKIDDYINSLDRESLLIKADKLFQVCKPPAKFSPLKNYSYDKERLKTLDEKRHEIVHKSNVITPLQNGDDDIWFLQLTAHYFMRLVNYKYSLKIRPSYVINTQKQKI